MKNKINTKSFDMANYQIYILRKHFPMVFTEEKIDFDKLKNLLSPIVASNDEKYTLNWAGRNETFRNIQTPATSTLVPDKKESVNFDDAENIFIEGENLEVLKLLQKSYFGKIKMIYIDPPYNTGKDFIYRDNFHENISSYLEKTGQTKDGVKLTTNTETSGRFHSDWISMMYARLFVARNLLTDDGVIFVSIDDNEVNNLIFILNEIFGEENQISNIIWHRKRGRDNSAKYLSKSHEYLLFYAKNKNMTKINRLELDESTLKDYSNPDNDPRGDWRSLGLWSRGTQGGSKFEFISKLGKKFSKRLWLVNKQSMEKLELDNKLVFVKDNVYRKLFLDENKGKIPETLWDDVSNAANAADEIKQIFGSQIFDTAKPLPYLRRMMEISTQKNDIILDFFAGSGTTAHAVMDLNKEDGGDRKFITVQIPEENKTESKKEYHTIADICKERIRRVIKNLNADKNTDLGFKVFKLAKSNYKIWENYQGKDEKELQEQIRLFESPLVEKYKDEDVIYECIVKEGYSLNSKIEKLKIKSNIVYKITDDVDSFYICLDKTIAENILEEVKIINNDMLICIDAALDDNQKANLSMKCDLRTM